MTPLPTLPTAAPAPLPLPDACPRSGPTPSRIALACLGLVTSLAATAAPPASPAATPAASTAATTATASPETGLTSTVQQLIEQARHWQQRGRADLAGQTWQKLLGVDPRQPDALYGLATQSVEAGRFEEAGAYLQRLRQVRPDHPGIGTLARQVQSQSSNKALIATARQYAQAGQTEAAASTYKQALGAQPPADDLAIEYYQTLGGTREGWDEAKRGLERLQQATPSQHGPALALAKHLSYREPTRRDAVRRLAALASQPDAPPQIQKDARAAWRQALVWMDARGPDAPLFRQYLAAAGDDAELSTKLAELGQPGKARAAASASGTATAAGADSPRKAAPTSTSATARRAQPAPLLAVRQGFAALDAGDVKTATERFNAVLLQRPDETDALAGLGIVRMREDRFTEASELLGRASAARNGARWAPVYRSAMHWQAVHDGQAARQAGDLDRATRLAKGAVETDPKEPEGQVLLGDLLAEQGQFLGADAAYREALRADARHPRANAGLHHVLGASGRTELQRAHLQRMDAEVLALLGGEKGLQAGQMRLQADLAQQRGDLAGAQALLEQAVATAPGSPWVRLSLGQLLMRQNRPDAARAQVDAFVVPAAQPGEALLARALLQSELKDWTGALQSLDQVPARERSTEMGRLQRRLAVQAQAADAIAQARAGQRWQAEALLVEAEAAAGQDPDMVGAVAGARMELGDEARAGQLIRATLAAQPQAGAGLRLRHAALLLQTRQDAELAGVLRQLAAQPLTAGQRRDFDELRIALSLRQADQLRDGGDLYNAWEALAPVLQERPQEPRLQMALARLHTAAGDHAQARALYESVLQKQPGQLDAWLGLAGAADGQKDKDSAAMALQEASRIAPNSPAVLAQYARHHRALGQFGKAAEYLRAAIVAEQPQRQANALQWGQARAAGNPFAAHAADGRARTLVAGGLPALVTPLASLDLDQLPPTGAGLPSARVGGESAVSRSQRWRDPVPVAAAAAAAQPNILLAQAAPVPPLSAPRPALPARPLRATRTLGDELSEVQIEQGRTSLETAGVIRSRSGEAGLGQLDLVQTPIEGRKTIEDVGQLSVQVTPVVASAGQVSQAARSRSGTLGLDATGVTVAPSQSDAGVGVAVALKTRTLTVDVGTTPIGFAVTDVVGGLRYIDEFAQGMTLTVDASRRALTDSLLAFAGSKDERTGRIWGGVRATGARVQLAWGQADVGVYGYGSLHALTGEQVASNSRVELGTGSFWQAQRLADTQVEVGMNLGYQHHRRNLSGYTWGHGGYFSPQHLLSLTVPVNWLGRSGRLSWGLQGSAGLQAYREEAAPYFPTDAAAQSTMDSLVAQQRAPASTYAARSDSGLVLNLGGALEYQITRQLDIGTRLGLERAAQYTQGTGSIYLRFSLEPRGAVSGLGLQMPGGPTGY
ncbi:cellulose biosynthesis protein BcsC [Sphaerotilus sp.]|uniref:cellulose biosynthesis protein BcsC n=1 Tax=Sphaerotilus sp. TaxID=2093942 RepID=UPI002ACEFA53|nr:cellulose synthase subunit BcsC-related outer membrane protein [Sphaerotilus sp.]MDZ7857931.1 cellulose synthase subunit BcsC-related outer membrane protein [Sphaerotilus sp.]